MIIRFPTGLYKPILPTGSQSGNITWTISTEDPPRSPVRLTQIPVAEELEPNPDRIFTDRERRGQFGELVYTIARNSRSNPGSNVKQYELGEDLAFEINPPEQEVLPLESPKELEIQHNTNLLDLESLGLTEDEIASLVEGSEERQVKLESEFNMKNIEARNLETSIVENQKKINETNKAIKATREVFEIPDGDLTNSNEIYQKLLATLADLEIQREQLIADRNAIVQDLKSITESIRRVSELVR